MLTNNSAAELVLVSKKRFMFYSRSRDMKCSADEMSMLPIH